MRAFLEFKATALKFPKALFLLVLAAKKLMPRRPLTMNISNRQGFRLVPTGFGCLNPSIYSQNSQLFSVKSPPSKGLFCNEIYLPMGGPVDRRLRSRMRSTDSISGPIQSGRVSRDG